MVDLAIHGATSSLTGFRKLLKYGGASRDRTDDLIVANDALSQLSYSPVQSFPECSVILSAFPCSTNFPQAFWRFMPAFGRDHNEFS